MALTDWITLIDRGTKIVGLEMDTADRMIVLNQFGQWGVERSLPVYLWNPGFQTVQEVQINQSSLTLKPTDWQIGSREAVMPTLANRCEMDGIYLIEGMLKGIPGDEMPNNLTYQMLNSFYQFTTEERRRYWVLMEEFILFPLDLQPLIPVIVKGLPNRTEVQSLVVEETQEIKSAEPDDPEPLAYLCRACQGLPEGEIRIILKRFESADFRKTANRIIAHKTDKLKGAGLEFISEPDVPKAGGLDLLAQRLDVVAAMLNPQVEKYGLKFPVGMVLWGPPGTGKSLSAKLTAKKMGVPLLATDWGGILGSSQPDRLLRQTLALAEALSPTILYFDDLDKGLGDWKSGADGGIGRRMIGKLLTWMQERQSPVFLVATVNRLGMMPPELIRRFDDIFFVDLPTNGELYQIFNLWLAKYFPAFKNVTDETSPFTEYQWRLLLRDYRMCTAAEVAKAVRATAENIAYREMAAGRHPEHLTVTLEDLQEQRLNFVPQMIREENQMLEIRNLATFARPASGKDKSRFAIPPQTLFGANSKQ